MTNRRYIIAGAPCAGKSTFAKNSAQAGDLIFDYDTIHAAFSGLGSHDHLDEIRPYVLAAREAVFHELEAHKKQAAFVITSSPKRAELEALAARFEAEIVFLEVTQEQAHNRAALDERPESWHNYINNWFSETDIDPGEYYQVTSKYLELINMKTKTFKAAIELTEDGDPGSFKAVFATLNVKDWDSDVTIPGAFHEQAVIIEPWNHDYGLPAGQGFIKSDTVEAWVEGRFILETQIGRENYETVKALGPLAEWSYTFNVLESESGEFEGERVNFLKDLDVIGVSPVTRGAGIRTRTVDIKSREELEEENLGEAKSKPRDYYLSLIEILEIQTKKILSE